MLSAIGACLIPAGAVFLAPVGAAVKYAVNVAAFGGMQIAISIFSIFAVSMIQQNTPDHLIGKVMAYTSAITMCAQPAGQMAYGFLFDRFQGEVFLVLIPSGAAVCAGMWGHVDSMDAMTVGLITVVIIRVLAAHFHWNLPKAKL